MAITYTNPQPAGTTIAPGVIKRTGTFTYNKGGGNGPGTTGQGSLWDVGPSSIKLAPGLGPDISSTDVQNENHTAQVGPTPPKNAAEAAAQYQRDLPGYLAQQIGAAGDQSRLNLAKEIQAGRASANSRGLLYSGQESDIENHAKAMEGGNLAGKIQDINASGQAQGAYLKQSAVLDAQTMDQFNTTMDSLKAQASQTAYEQALQEQTNQQNFYAGLGTSVGQMIGSAFGSLGGGGQNNG